jgi:hypothetical protein
LLEKDWDIRLFANLILKIFLRKCIIIMMDNAAVVEKKKISKLLEFFNILQVFYNRFSLNIKNTEELFWTRSN